LGVYKFPSKPINTVFEKKYLLKFLVRKADKSLFTHVEEDLTKESQAARDQPLQKKNK
jgi:hypothetical protein